MTIEESSCRVQHWRHVAKTCCKRRKRAARAAL